MSPSTDKLLSVKMSGTQLQLGSLKSEWDSCKAHDDQKNSLIRGLFAYVDGLSSQLSEAAAELQDKRDAIKVVREQAKRASDEIQDLKRDQARRAFALVLIDGDSMPFHDDLIRQGLDGGKKTASLLKQAVEAALQTSIPGATHHMEIMVRVYANMEGLSMVYNELEIAPESTTTSFVRGFNMGHALCDFVDAGNGKECSDEKVKAMFRTHLEDIHCQRILFGGSTDGGYARLLGSYVEYEAVRQRVILLEGPGFAQELASIKDRFRTVTFEHIFRSRKLPDRPRRVASRTTPPPATTSANYATALAQAQDVNKLSTPSAKKESSASQPAPAKAVPQNRRGERVDPPHRFTPQDLAKLKYRKLCNSFHLLGKCQYLEKYGTCNHEHGKALQPTQTEMLRVIARQSPCLQGLSCQDSLCILGHRCTRIDCVPSTCRFPSDMHNVDTKIVK